MRPKESKTYSVVNFFRCTGGVLASTVLSSLTISPVVGSAHGAVFIEHVHAVGVVDLFQSVEVVLVLDLLAHLVVGRELAGEIAVGVVPIARFACVRVGDGGPSAQEVVLNGGGVALVVQDHSDLTQGIVVVGGGDGRAVVVLDDGNDPVIQVFVGDFRASFVYSSGLVSFGIHDHGHGIDGAAVVYLAEGVSRGGDGVAVRGF
jgi:hypothetical protein